MFLWDHIHLVRAMRLELHDPWVLLGAIAQATERVRLGAMVTPLPRRRPQKFAKEVVTLDHLSQGRVIVGVGLGAPADDEFTAFGEDAGDRARADVLDEALEVVTALWTGEPVEHRGDALHASTPSCIRSRCNDRGRRSGSRRRSARRVRCSAPRGTRASRSIGASEPEVTLDQIRAARDALPASCDVVAPWWPGPSVAAYADAGATWLSESRWPDGNWLDELEEAARQDPHSVA